MTASAKQRSWAACCGGPDGFAELEFRPEDDARLRAHVQAFGLSGYTRAVIRGPMRSQFTSAVAVDDFDAYVDSSRADAILGALRGGGGNVWIYRVVTVGASRVWFESGFLADDPELMAADVHLMESLVREPTLRLVRWSVISGGQGYGDAVVDSGEDGASLVAFLERTAS